MLEAHIHEQHSPTKLVEFLVKQLREVQWMSTFKSPRRYTNDDIIIVSERTSRVSLAGVLASDVQDTSAQHVVGDVRPAPEAWLGLQIGVALSTQLLVYDFHINMHELLRRWAVRLKNKMIKRQCAADSTAAGVSKEPPQACDQKMPKTLNCIFDMVECISAFVTPRDNTNNDIVVVSERTARVSLAGVLASDV
uniref:SFRICE_013570 n=1 Tax=Spodoptera frugiperda TaxID=7108 RepID=A0A2H1V915_SPOFR